MILQHLKSYFLGENMRTQELNKLQKLCDEFDLDIQRYDVDVYSYEDLERMIYHDAGVKTPKMEEEELMAWDAIAEWYDEQPLEDKMYIPEDMKQKIEMINCLVLKFNHRQFGFAVNLLTMLFKGNMMERTHRVLEVNKKLSAKHRVLWFMGPQKVTDQILIELQKRNIHPRILRNSFLRRDFIHYHNGKMFMMSNSLFKKATEKVSRQGEKEQQRQLLKALS